MSGDVLTREITDALIDASVACLASMIDHGLTARASYDALLRIMEKSIGPVAISIVLQEKSAQLDAAELDMGG